MNAQEGGVGVSVVVALPQHSGLGGALTYTHTQDLPLGTLVTVPLGRRRVPGVVWWPTEGAHGGGLRAIEEVLPLPPLSARWCELVAFAAQYYQRSLGEMALSALPPEWRQVTALNLARRLKRLPSAPAQPGGVPSAPEGRELTPEQALALARLQALAAASPTAPPPVLVHGVTGSGKTELYLQAAQEVLQRGQQVLVLVPEINLTPQLEARFRERFAQHTLVSLHSRLTTAQRLNHWLMAHLGRAQLVLGTRLAVLASLPRMGLVVVDEEHDPSYKQQEGARYSARDLAVYRGRLEGLPVLLGSATPALETWRHAQEQRYARLSLRDRVGQGALPRVRLVDMAQQGRGSRATGGLSAPLLAAVQQRIDAGEQSLLLLNRRGYAPVLHCPACAWKSACGHCSAWQVFHKADRSLRCHHCGDAQRVPRACPDCGNLDIEPLGRGTERLEEQLPSLLRGPSTRPLRVLRIDADSTRKVGSLEAQLAEVHGGEVDVLVGTQMVAKGHDFRRITLVAAVNPDGALFSSDFRAPERLFALLMQAAGRAGRDAALAGHSEMWLQTWHPEHALYQCLRRHDFEAFAQAQLAEREAVGLPPYTHLALLRAEARSTEAVLAFVQAARERAQQLLAEQPLGVTVYPAVPAAMARVADHERVQMLVESASRPALQAFLARWVPELLALKAQHRGVSRYAVDVDPMAI